VMSANVALLCCLATRTIALVSRSDNFFGLPLRRGLHSVFNAVLLENVGNAMFRYTHRNSNFTHSAATLEHLNHLGLFLSCVRHVVKSNLGFEGRLKKWEPFEVNSAYTLKNPRFNLSEDFPKGTVQYSSGGGDNIWIASFL
jgi:hypothetical protein